MFFQVLSAIGTAISVMSAMQAGRAAREQAEAQAAAGQGIKGLATANRKTIEKNRY